MATAAAVAVVGSTFAITSGVGATTVTDTDRLSGANRYATAAEIALSEDFFGVPGDGDDDGPIPVTIVNGENFPDGLAAAALESRILLVETNSIPAETLAALTALETGAAGEDDDLGVITVVGGSAVVSSAVLEQLDAINGTDAVRRLSGADRYATALAVAADIDAAPVTSDVVLATGENFPDALAAGPLAIANTGPLVLNQGDSLLPAVRTYLTGATGTVFIVGGEGVVPASIVTELQGLGVNVERLSGTTRDETAVEVADQTGNDNIAVLVNRAGFADALAAGPAAGAVSASIMPVGLTGIAAPVATWHVDNCGALDTVWAFGGTGVISAAVLDGAGAAAQCAQPAIASATVANSDVTQRVIEIIGTGGAAPTAGAGATLTAVPGSATDGPAGNDWDVIFVDGATNAAVITNPEELTVTIDDVTTMTQAEFVAAFNALPQAAALFTADDANVGAPVDFAALPVVDTNLVDGSIDQTVVVTFNVAVDNGAGATPEIADFVYAAPAAGGEIDTISPLVGTPTADGITEVTLFSDDVTDDTLVLAAGTATVNAGNGDIVSVSSNIVVLDTNLVTITAAS